MNPAAPGAGATVRQLSTAAALEAAPGAAAPDLLTAPQVCAHAHITYRQLDFWTRTSRLTAATRPAAAGSGVPRLYTPTEADIALLAAAMIRAGLTVDAAFTAARTLHAGLDNPAHLDPAAYGPQFVRLNGPLWLAVMP